MNRRRILLVVVLLIPIIAIGLLVSYFRSFQTLEVKFTGNDNPSIKIYQVIGHEAANTEYQNRQPVLETSSDTTRRVKKGSYVALAAAQGDFKEVDMEFHVGSQKTTVEIDPRYTDEKLKTLLTSERPAALNAILEQVPSIKPPEYNYNIAEGKLYGQGQWYATTIKPHTNDPETYVHTYRVVVKKEAGAWKVVTNPPGLILSSLTYPDIPRDVLVDVNKQ